MKFKILLLAISTPFLAFSQSTSEERSVRKDNVIFDLYIGGPQLLSNLNTNSGSTSTGVKSSLNSSGFGPIGGRIEYMFTPKSSIGLEVNHATSKMEFTWNDGVDKLSQEIKLDRTRIFPRYALHFGKKKLDAYWHVGLGLAFWDISSKVTDPSNTISATSTVSKTNGPILAFRTGLGLRYFFTDNFGLNADFGIGGALFTGGITFKL